MVSVNGVFHSFCFFFTLKFVLQGSFLFYRCVFPVCLTKFVSSWKDLGVAAMSPVSARPALTPHQVQFPKHQGINKDKVYNY